MNADLRAQILSDATEIELFGSQYPAGSRERAAFFYCAEIIRREFSMTDAEKLDLTLRILERVQPCTKTELIERMDFTREESRRIIELGIQQGLIDQYQEATNGRPRVMLRIP